MATIRTSIESARGCGRRKARGLYLVCPLGGEPCGRLPHVLDACPTCGGGIKPARSWTWINPKALLGIHQCAQAGGGFSQYRACGRCPLNPGRIMDRAGLLWIGEQFYPTPEDWLKEVAEMGVSRRISAVPRDFKVGETYVFAAHRKCVSAYKLHDRRILPDGCCDKECPGKISGVHGCKIYDEPIMCVLNVLRCRSCSEDLPPSVMRPAIFHVFRPTAIEYVVEGNETTEELDAIEERGIELVKVVPDSTEEEVVT